MARARNIKPGFFKNEDLAECSVWARLCFAGLWTLADREGRLEDRPKRIKGELFAFDSIEVEPLLEELQAHGFIERYRVESLGIIQVVAFLKHQNPHHREPESDLPPNQSPGLDAVGNSQKPQALPTCQPPPAPGQPQASLGLDPPRVDLARGSSRAESGIDESGIDESGDTTIAPVPGTGKPLGVPELVAEGVSAQAAADWLKVRKANKAPLTRTAWDGVKREAGKAGMSPGEAVSLAAERCWRGFSAEWVQNDRNGGRGGSRPVEDIYAGAV